MPKLIFAFVLLLPISAFTQTDTVFVRYPNHDEGGYHTDTIPQNYAYSHLWLVGTCVLPDYGQLLAMSQGVHFTKVTKAPCNNDMEVHSISSHINGYNLTDSTLTVDMTFVDNCCYEFLCSIKPGEDGCISTTPVTAITADANAVSGWSTILSWTAAPTASI